MNQRDNSMIFPDAISWFNRMVTGENLVLLILISLAFSSFAPIGPVRVLSVMFPLDLSVLALFAYFQWKNGRFENWWMLYIWYFAITAGCAWSFGFTPWMIVGIAGMVITFVSIAVMKPVIEQARA